MSEVLAHYLAAHHHDITIALSAEEAARAIGAGLRPNVVLLDINLPGESGWQFLRSGILASAGNPPVFILSAIHINSARLREFGCAGYLPKPFAISTLLEIVERHRETGNATADEPGTGDAAGTGADDRSYNQNGSERTFEDELAFGDDPGWPSTPSAGSPNRPGEGRT